MLGLCYRFLNEDEGATMVEYALMVVSISVLCLLVVASLGDGVYDTLDPAATEIQGVLASPQNPTTPAD